MALVFSWDKFLKWADPWRYNMLAELSYIPSSLTEWKRLVMTVARDEIFKAALESFSVYLNPR